MISNHSFVKALKISKKQRPDVNQLAHSILQRTIAMGEKVQPEEPKEDQKPEENKTEESDKRHTRNILIKLKFFANNLSLDEHSQI